jgi:2-polyprenyl-3-methyl-5-hydroxy-6-metoxy-1,4-benzoquinol methylase
MCPVCGFPKRLYEFEKQGRQYCKCLRCEFVYSLPRPTVEELSKLYSEMGYDYFTTPEMLAFFFAPHRFGRELAIVSQYLSKQSRLLEIGCCVGAFVKASIDAGYDAIGMDVSVPAVEYGRRLGLPLEISNVLECQGEGCFDAVCMWATLEHVPDPIGFLRKAYKLVRTDGWVFVSVPNFDSMSHRLLGANDSMVSAEHLNYFTPSVLSRALAQVGLTTRHLCTFGFNPITLLRDLCNGRRQPGRTEQMKCANVTRQLRSTSLRYVHRGVEVLLDKLLQKGDCLAIAAQKTGKRAIYCESVAS